MRSSSLIALALFACALAACESSGPSDPSLAYLHLSINAKTVDLGVDQQIQLSVTAPHGSSIDWQTLNPTVATVSSTGLVAARSIGTAKVVASSGKSKDTATVTVHAAVATIRVTPDTVITVPGQSAQLSFQAFDKSGHLITGVNPSSAHWASSAPSVATVSSTGVLQTTAVGAALITLDLSGKTDTATVQVTAVQIAALSVSPSPAEVNLGGELQLTAVAKDVTGAQLQDRPIAWSSSDTSIVSVSSVGAVTAHHVGSALVTASAEGKTALTTVNATPGIIATVAVALAASSLASGQTTQAIATARDTAGNVVTGLPVTWSSATPSVATVSTLGIVMGVSAGTSEIKATIAGVTGSAVVTVSTGTVATVGVSLGSTMLTTGQTTQATATARDAGGNTLTGLAVAWSSSNQAAATVSSSGLVTSVAPGTASITATVDTKTGSATLTSATPIVTSIVVSAPTSTLGVGQTIQATATVKDQNGTATTAPVTWTSSAPAVATVSSTGLITGLTVGDASIKATSGTVSGAMTSSVTTQSSTNLVLPELPRGYVDSRSVAPTGVTITVAAGGNLQTAINNANPGDVIVLQAGATYSGNFTLPVKTGGDASHWVTIRSSAMGQLPAEGSRVNPTYASAMPKIVTWDASAPAFATLPGASYYRLVGLEVTIPTSATLSYGIVRLGSSGTEQNSLSQVPHHIVLDRMYVHGNSTASVQRCIAFNSAWTAVVDSYLSECHAKGFDAQAIGGWNGPGPFKIVNNYLEGSGENILFGGADPSISQLVPSDMEIRHNHFIKPLSWKGVWTVKNLFELKNGQRVLLEGNVLENCWVDAQGGIAILMQALSDNNTAAWTTVRDVTVRYNIIRNAVGGASVLSRIAYGTNGLLPSEPSQRISFQHNLFEQMGSGNLFGMYGDLQNASLIHNTGFATNATILMDGDPETGFVAKDNVLAHGAYGFFGSSYGEGNYALNHYVPGAVILGNVLFGGANPAIYPVGNFFPATVNDVGFANYAGGDFSLSAWSAYHGKATDGTDPGVDFAALRAALVGVAQP